MRILITGASGFVGRSLAPALVEAGYRVRAAARDVSLLRMTAATELVALPDLAAPIEWAPLLADVDAIVHLAGIAHITSGIDATWYDAVNRAATGALARAAAAAGVGRLVFLSSIRAQTGPTADHTVTELDDPQPTDAYGVSKLAAEAEIRAAGVPFTILRPVVIYGPGVKGNMATLLRIAGLRLPLPLGAFANRRSMLAIDNLISAIRFVLETPATAGQTYVVADTEALTLAEIVAVLQRGRGRGAGLFRVPPVLFAPALKLAGLGEHWDRVAGDLVTDAGKLRAAGWTPAEDTRTALTALARDAPPGKLRTAARNTR